MPLNIENNDGYVPWFFLRSYTDDRQFENLFVEFVKMRPREFDLNYQSEKAKSLTGEDKVTLFHLVMEKCPSFHKLKIFVDFGYDFYRERQLVDKVIKLINKSNYS